MVQKSLRQIICIAILTSLVSPFASCLAAQRGELVNIAAFDSILVIFEQGSRIALKLVNSIIWENTWGINVIPAHY